MSGAARPQCLIPSRLLNLSWPAMMTLFARLRGAVPWAKLLLFITCYAMGIIIDRSFDVVIERPMVGILCWAVFGAGIGLALTSDALCPDRLARLSHEAWRP